MLTAQLLETLAHWFLCACALFLLGMELWGTVTVSGAEGKKSFAEQLHGLMCPAAAAAQGSWFSKFLPGLPTAATLQADLAGHRFLCFLHAYFGDMFTQILCSLFKLPRWFTYTELYIPLPNTCCAVFLPHPMYRLSFWQCSFFYKHC